MTAPSNQQLRLRECPMCKCAPLESSSRMGTLEELKWLYSLYCPECGLSTRHFDFKGHSIEYWNSRPLEDAKDREIQDLKSQIESLKLSLESIMKFEEKKTNKRIAKLEEGLGDARKALLSCGLSKEGKEYYSEGLVSKAVLTIDALLGDKEGE